VPRTTPYFIPSATTGFIASVFLYPNRVSLTEAFEVLEPDDGKLSRPVLRGPDLNDGVRLLDPPDDAPPDVLGLYWGQIDDSIKIKASEATRARLLEACIQKPELTASLLHSR
jgi:hypothetical protein